MTAAHFRLITQTLNNTNRKQQPIRTDVIPNTPKQDIGQTL